MIRFPELTILRKTQGCTPVLTQESKTAGLRSAPAVGRFKGNESDRRYIPPTGGALGIELWDKLMFVILFRASFLYLDDITLILLDGTVCVKNFTEEKLPTLAHQPCLRIFGIAKIFDGNILKATFIFYKLVEFPLIGRRTSNQSQLVNAATGMPQKFTEPGNDLVGQVGFVEVDPNPHAVTLFDEEVRLGLHEGNQRIFVAAKAAKVQAK
jgi:hypothetical protein